MSSGLVGSPAARAIQGRSADADLIWAASAGDLAATEPDQGLVDSFATLAIRPGSVAGDLTELARIAAGNDKRALVIAAADLRLSLPGLLDLLDRPGDRTAALLADSHNIEARRMGFENLDRASLVRVGADGALIESVATSRHSVSAPNRVSVGLLRIAAADRRRAAALLQAAAGTADLAGPDVFDATLLILVRGGLEIGNQPVGYYDWSRGAVAQHGVPGSGWQQRLRTASRLGDGFYSTFVVRPLSRYGTALGLRLNLTPNVVSLISLIIGLGTAELIWTGEPWAWVLAAFTLQLALIIDCMDGEIARFRRRFSALGGWIDGVGDRVKEYAVFAALAAVAMRDGAGYGWLLAIIAMTVVTARHLEDYSYTDKLAPVRRSKINILPVSHPGDGGPDDARTTLPAAPSRRQVIIFWIKKVIHVPIAERYLILSLFLFTQSAVVVLVVSIAASMIALIWTVGGRFVRALIDPFPEPVEGASGGAFDRLRERLGDQLDLGPLGRLAGRVGHLRLGWLALPLVWVGEAAVISALLLGSDPVSGGNVFAFLAVVAFRRYDLVYSLQLTGIRPSRTIAALGLGPEGRVLLIIVVWAALTLVGVGVGTGMTITLAVLGGYLLLLYLVASARTWSAESNPAG